jgi:lipopolysaccharide transport system ATP-binding protein
MDDVTRRGRTVLLVTHNLGMVTRHCKRALLLDGGRIIKSGSATDVVDHYDAMCAPRETATPATVPAGSVNNCEDPGDS